MADRASPPQPPIFNLNAYSPAEIKEAVEKVGVKKTNLPFLASLMLAVIAGGSIGLGALYYTVIVSDAGLSFAAARVMGGVAFSLGLVIVLVGGAELFTGNNLIVMAWASGHVTTKEMLRNWVVVYFGNSDRRARTCGPGLPFASSRHEWRPRRPVDIEYGCRQDPARRCNAYSSREFCVTCSFAWRYGLPMPAGRLPTKLLRSYFQSPPSSPPALNTASPTCISCRWPG